MILDSSAIIAILCEEPGYRELIDRIEESDFVALAAPTLLESAMVVGTRLKTDGFSAVNDFIGELGIEVIHFSERHASEAYSAFLRYGKGRHAAGLNFGDCMSYATARLSGSPLLFIGKDFTRTDIPAA